jgi:hypothetical protein
MAQVQLIHNEDEVKRFVRMLAPLENHEMYFVSLSARNKYLTEDERREYSLGRTEMFNRRMVKNSKHSSLEDTYVRVLRSMECDERGYLTRNGKPIPSKTLIAYALINPSDGFEAARQFSQQVLHQAFEEHTEDAMSFFGHIDSKLNNNLQAATKRKVWIDIDFDVPHKYRHALEEFLKELRSLGVEAHPISTKSGFHVLLKKETLKFNYVQLVKNYDDWLNVEIDSEKTVEAIINRNAMIPIPGTIQGGYEVHFLDI